MHIHTWIDALIYINLYLFIYIYLFISKDAVGHGAVRADANDVCKLREKSARHNFAVFTQHPFGVYCWLVCLL